MTSLHGYNYDTYEAAGFGPGDHIDFDDLYGWPENNQWRCYDSCGCSSEPCTCMCEVEDYYAVMEERRSWWLTCCLLDALRALKIDEDDILIDRLSAQRDAEVDLKMYLRPPQPESELEAFMRLHPNGAKPARRTRWITLSTGKVVRRQRHGTSAWAKAARFRRETQDLWWGEAELRRQYLNRAGTWVEEDDDHPELGMVAPQSQ